MPDLSELLDKVLRWLEPLYLSYGYGIVVLAALVEHTFFLAWAIPGGILVALGGLYAQSGTLSLPLVVVFAALGFLIGDHIDFLVGRRSASLLYRVTRGRTLDEKHIWQWRAVPALVLAYTNTVPRAAVFMGGSAAGLAYRRFLVLATSLAVFWSTVFSILGYVLGSNRDRLEGVLKGIGVGGQAAIIALVVLLVVFLRYRKRSHGPSARSGAGVEPGH